MSSLYQQPNWIYCLAPSFIRDDNAFSSHSREAEIKDFISLLKPGVLSLVVFTGLIGMLLAPETKHPFIMGVNLLALAMASAGSAVFNMWYDRDIDSMMGRTRQRPIPRGVIAPADALTLAVLLSGGSILLMGLTGAWEASLLLAFSILFYSYIYTVLLKRLTPYNIVIGGAAGAFPPVIGWMTQTDSFGFLPWWMFTLIFLWTPSHFWALALLRVEEYALVKVPMLPVTQGTRMTQRHIYLYAVLLVLASFLPLFTQDLGGVYGIASFLLGGCYIYYTHRLWKTGLPQEAGGLFGYSIFYLFALFAAMAIDRRWEVLFFG